MQRMLMLVQRSGPDRIIWARRGDDEAAFPRPGPPLEPYIRANSCIYNYLLLRPV
jgi:hypothetical protein